MIYTHSLTGLTADRFFPTAMPFFLAGMLACRWRATITRHNIFGWLAGSGTFACVFSISALSEIGIRLGIPGQLFGLGFAAVAFCGIPVLFAASNARSSPAWMRQWDAEMGALSYPIYLVHWQVITAFEAFRPASAARTVVIIVVVIAFAAALTRWIEEPLDRYRKRRREQLHARNISLDPLLNSDQTATALG